MAERRIEIRVLGPFGVLVDGDPVDISAGRSSALLAALAMSSGQVVSIERLTDLVWGEHPPANARRTVQTYAYRLRTALGSETISTVGAGYLLNVHPHDVDALRFVGLLDTADRDPATERDQIATALGLWRGDPLEGVQSEWLIEYERPRLVERYLSALERRMDLDIATGRAADVIAEVREVAGQHPLRESMWTRLIVALDRCGRAAEALECYETIRSRIAGELGVDPGPGLQRIYADLLHGATPEPSPRQSQPTPEQTVPRQLPADVEGFTGREDVLADLDSLVDGDRHAPPPVVIAVLNGVGGIGKTAVAVRWAHRVSEQFPDGQLYLDLRGFGPGEPTAPAQALETLLRGLGVPAERVSADLDARSAQLRTVLADRRLLMVLDNARDAEQVRPLLPGGRGALVILTSRSQMRGLTAREGARRIAVDTLPLKDAVDLLARGLDRQRVAYDEGSLTALAGLCGRLPLALAVAVERASLFRDSKVAELVGELRDEQNRLDALDPGDDPLTSVRAVFSWSYRALDEQAARTFRLLGLHLGMDICPPAAAALAGSTRSHLTRLLDRLADVNLLQRLRQGRYAMHDLLRAYAAELVDEIDDEASRKMAIRRLVSWYVHSAAAAQIEVSRDPDRRFMDMGVPEIGVTPLSFADRRQAHDWLDAEWPTLVRLVPYAAAHGHPQAAYRLVNKLHEYLLSDRPPAEAAALQEIARQAAVAVGRRVDEGFITNQLGISYGRLGDYERCIDLLERAKQLFQVEQHTGGERMALHNLGIAQIGARRLDDARDSLEQALALHSDEDDSGEVERTLIDLSRLHLEAGQIDEAVSAASDALSRLSGSDRVVSEASARQTLALARAAQGRHGEAEECLVSALDTFRALGLRWPEAVILACLGRVQRDTNRPEEARRTWQRALAIVDEVGEMDSTDLSRADLVELLDSVSEA